VPVGLPPQRPASSIRAREDGPERRPAQEGQPSPDAGEHPAVEISPRRRIARRTLFELGRRRRERPQATASPSHGRDIQRCVLAPLSIGTRSSEPTGPRPASVTADERGAHGCARLVRCGRERAQAAGSAPPLACGPPSGPVPASDRARGGAVQRSRTGCAGRRARLGRGSSHVWRARRRPSRTRPLLDLTPAQPDRPRAPRRQPGANGDSGSRPARRPGQPSARGLRATG
jgi:hypothetical protein